MILPDAEKRGFVQKIQGKQPIPKYTMSKKSQGTTINSTIGCAQQTYQQLRPGFGLWGLRPGWQSAAELAAESHVQCSAGEDFGGYPLDLTATSLGMMVNKGNHTPIALIQVGEL